uniref:Atg6 BARA domain-containing protein n=1 Tax=Balaenoptera musculus TaxID=9771 RepID=A0A8C0CDH0_BALMU
LEGLLFNTSTMSSLRFICQRCSQPLKLNQSMETSQEPEALMLISAQGEPGETQEGGPPSREEADFENLQEGVSYRTLPGLPGGRMSWDNSDNFTLLGNLGSLRTLNSIQKLEETRLVRELEEAAQAETEMLDQQEKQYQKDYSKLKWQQLELHDELSSVEKRLWYAQIQWNQLEKTSVFNATFEIWHDGPLTTINNFRLGCLPTDPVCWNEINIAWGQTALLLLALSNTIGLEFQRYRLIPCGNHSYLKSLTDDCIEGERKG